VLSFGGGEFKITSELMGVDKNRKNLINNIINFIDKYNLDGFDCDWEPTWEDDKLEMELTNNTINDYYLIFIKEFRQNLDARFGKGSKSFSAAVLNKNSVWYSEDKQIAHFPKNAWWNHLDWVSLMNYDNALGESHATFNSVFGPNGSIAHWKNFGVPVEKIVIGIPFYARADWGDEWIFYKDIMNIKSIINDSIDFISYSKDNSKVKDYGFNGVLTVSKKAREAKKLNLAGVMMWQLAGDLPVEHKKSLLKNISDEMNQ
jgi:GH18 family chitinase